MMLYADADPSNLTIIAAQASLSSRTQADAD